MKTPTILTLLINLALTVQTAFALPVNELKIQTLDCGAGKEASVPVYLNNASDVVAAQFRLQLPVGITLSDTTNMVLTDRKDNHSFSVKKMGDNDYLFVIFSLTNRPILGNSGILLRIPVMVSDTCREAAIYPFAFSQVILSDVSGKNVATASSPGGIRIISLPRPDLAVQQVRFTSVELAAGDALDVSWSVRNVGELKTADGWSEQVFLISDVGETSLLGTTYYGNLLESGGVVSRNASFTLGDLPGVDGLVKVMVKVVPNALLGELPATLTNNSGKSNDYLTVKSKLLLKLDRNVLGENDPNPLYGQLFRSGSRLMDQTFSLVANPTGRLMVPLNITIPAGQSGVSFNMIALDNSVVNVDSMVVFEVSGNQYPAVSQSVRMVDNELPSLTLTPSKTILNEGDRFNLLVEREIVTAKPLAVNLYSDFSKRLSISNEAIIPAGQKSVSVEVTVVEDIVPSLTVEPILTATSEGYLDGICHTTLKDNDVPVIQMTLSPSSFSESAGYQAAVGVVKRQGTTDNNITIQLTDDSNGALYYSMPMMVLEKGVAEKRFTIGVVDNALVDTNLVVNVTASVYLNSCGCSTLGTGAGVVHSILTILDDDGPTLKLTASQALLPEGKQDASMLTVSRNTSTTNALTVALTSDRASEITHALSVVIPAGQRSVSVPVTALLNALSEGNRTVTFTATANGFSRGVCWATITDMTLPDATVDVTSLSASAVLTKNPVDVTLQIKNVGLSAFPSNASVDIWFCSDSILALSGTRLLLTTLYTTNSILPNKSESLTATLNVPDLTGQFYLLAEVNAEHAKEELNYLNNDSKGLPVRVSPAYTVLVNSDKPVYKPGEIISITGSALPYGNTDVGGVPVDVYLFNDGFRKHFPVTTDATGAFQFNFEPYAGQMGRFSVSACYPGMNLTDEQAVFAIYGLKRASWENLAWDLLTGETVTGEILLTNPGTAALTALTANLLTDTLGWDLQFQPIPDLAGGATVALKYTMKAKYPNSTTNYQPIRFAVSSAQGASLEMTGYFYCRNPWAMLAATPSSIQSTMSKGKSRSISFTVTNNGKGASGKISILLPSLPWMSLLTPVEMPSLEFGESATVRLQLAPDANMPVNVPITGTIGVNCANGSGIPISFNLETVSEAVGTLSVDVCDEFTYYTAEAPHLKGASVVVRHPYTNAVVAQGITNDQGLFVAENLPEGYYSLSVSADKHDSYTNNIVVDPGKTTSTKVNLSFQAITYSWNVVETTVEDVYTIETVVKYETNVPAPIVIIDVPSEVNTDHLLPGESLVFNMTLTNKGLITAKDVVLQMPQGFVTLTFEPMIQGIFDLRPQESITVPVKVTKILEVNAMVRLRSVSSIQGSKKDPCDEEAGALYFWDCGLDRKWHRYGAAIKFGDCGGTTKPTEGGGTKISIEDMIKYLTEQRTDLNMVQLPSPCFGNAITPVPVVSDAFDCEPCANSFLWKMTRGLLKQLPVIGPAIRGYETVQMVYNLSTKKSMKLRQGVSVTNSSAAQKDLYKKIGEKYKEIKPWADAANDLLRPLIEKCVPGNFDAPRLRSTKVMPGYIENYQEVLTQILSQTNAFVIQANELVGDLAWWDVSYDVAAPFWDKIFAIDGIIDPNSELRTYKPAQISEDQYQKLVLRFNNSRLNLNVANKFDSIRFDSCWTVIDEVLAFALNKGYTSVEEMFDLETKAWQRMSDEASSSVCSSISLQFSQTMTLTRQAFRGTLTVFNGHEYDAMQQIKLTLEVTDSEGKIAGSQQFQINTESVDKLTAIDGTGSLGAKLNGTATILFIPTKLAAPTEPKEYYFGGKLSYLDPFTGIVVTRELYPVTLTVRPSPDLSLTYFMQRDVMGDDALTPEVEPSQPAEFSLLINNHGAGDATKVNISTAQPKIVDNEKGLLAEFELIGSSLNGVPASTGVTEIDFGTIPAGKTTYGQWWFTSSLLGHFVSYDVKLTHVTSYDNPNLSLVSDVSIHELIRSFRLGADLTGFLVNDLPDAADYPDALYLSDGVRKEVHLASMASCTPVGEHTWALSVIPSAQGWNYSMYSDPLNGKSKLISCIRQRDGLQVNNWQTDRTLRDGKEPLYANRIHLADEFLQGPETYLLTFEPIRQNVLEVDSILNVPVKLAEYSLQTVRVQFSQPIDSSTFTKDDVRLWCQGVDLDLSNLSIRRLSASEYELDLSALTGKSGYYVLTVQTAVVLDSAGMPGETGKTVGWTQYVGGQVRVTATVQPVGSGFVTPGTGLYSYGTNVAFRARPAVGQHFVSWTSNGDVLTTDTMLLYSILTEKSLTANFEPNFHTVSLTCIAEEGSVSGASAGVYRYGTVLRFVATPAMNYALEGWLVNGVFTASTQPLVLAVTQETTVQPRFVSTLVTMDYTLRAGWNWISSNLSDARFRNPLLFLSPVRGFVDRMKGVRAQLVADSVGNLAGDLAVLPAEHMFKLNLKSDVCWLANGTPFATDRLTIDLQKGWNWMSYVPTRSMTLPHALTALTALTNEVVKSQTGFAMYNGSEWIGTLDSLAPGQGYQYWSNSDKNFQYPALETRSSKYRSARNQQPDYLELNSRKYPDNMNVIARLYLGNNLVNPGDYTVAAYERDTCRGVGTYLDDRLFLMVYGSNSGEKLDLRAIDRSSGKMYTIQEPILFADTVMGTLSQPMALHLGAEYTAMGRNNLLFTVWPNPVRNILHIVSEVPSVKAVRVMSLDGRVLMMSNLDSTVKEVDVTSLADGIYSIALITEWGTWHRKFIKTGSR